MPHNQVSYKCMHVNPSIDCLFSQSSYLLNLNTTLYSDAQHSLHEMTQACNVVHLSLYIGSVYPSRICHPLAIWSNKLWSCMLFLQLCLYRDGLKNHSREKAYWIQINKGCFCSLDLKAISYANRAASMASITIAYLLEIQNYYNYYQSVFKLPNWHDQSQQKEIFYLYDTDNDLYLNNNCADSY